MFEKRLRIFLLFIFIGGCLLAARAAQVQVVQRDDWAQQAASNAEKVVYSPARRGDLLDVKGRVIATDAPSFEASVNYCVVGSEPDPRWLRDEATRRARKRAGWASADADARALTLAEEQRGVRNDLDAMWDMLAAISKQDRSQVDAIRQGIDFDVRQKQEDYVQRQYNAALEAFRSTPAPRWYARWIAGAPQRPELETFLRNPKLQIGDQFAFHTILPDLTPEQYNALALAQERLPQMASRGDDGRPTTASVLKLRPAVRRVYPYGDAACHVIGHVGVVLKEDVDGDPNKGDELRRYRTVDRIGRDGLEALAEPLLRGARGQTTRDRSGRTVQSVDAVAGRDVRSTIDIELQRQIRPAFDSVEFEEKDVNGKPVLPREHIPMNGAAIVIDVRTGQVRAMVSVPTFDLNQFDALYEKLQSDDVRRPMVNRALLDAIEPGSSVKPIVGLGAVTQKIIGVTDTIECTGYPIINGRRLDHPRCWTMSMHAKSGHGAHHEIPYAKPHPTGFLTLADAVERSCNVYFMTLGDKLAIDGLSRWMREFGFGAPTGIGLPEARGVVPANARIPADQREFDTLLASIGQGPVLATPIQVCNEIATIARDGVWVRPTVLVDPLPPGPPSTQPGVAERRPDRVDLHLDPAALRAVHEGMVNVVNSAAGTGQQVARDDVLVAAKTGSATASPLNHYFRNPDGTLMRIDGKLAYDPIPYGSGKSPNPEYPWYRLSGYDDATGKPKGTHSWVTGYAPANDPQVAFAVYVEYGGSGGIGAGSVVRKLLDACRDNGYLKTTPPQPTAPPASLARPADEPTPDH